MNEIEFIEKYFNIKLLEYQKCLLKIMIENPNSIYLPRGTFKWSKEVAQCIQILNELKN